MRTIPLVAFVVCLALPAGAKNLKCADGATVAKGSHGGCSHHGGVAAVEPKAEQPRPGTVMCKDGATVKDGPDACAHHGGAPEEAAASATGATAQCRDGTYSHAAHGQGACARHGGVVHWMK